jgi:hypothetical protein
MRVYKIADTHLLYESKFLFDRLEVDATSLKNDWKNMTEAERLEFAMAFNAKPTLQLRDEEILNHLMEIGSAGVLATLALVLLRHSDKERSFRFLTRQIESVQMPLVNYYQALELLNDRRAVPLLRKSFETYKARLASKESDESEMVDYLQCAKALLTMDGAASYEQIISELCSYPSQRVSRFAQRLLQPKK